MGKRKRKRSIIVEQEVDDSWAAPQHPPPLAATLHASERSAKQARKEAREFLKAVPEAAEKKAAKVGKRKAATAAMGGGSRKKKKKKKGPSDGGEAGASPFAQLVASGSGGQAVAPRQASDGQALTELRSDTQPVKIDDLCAAEMRLLVMRLDFGAASHASQCCIKEQISEMLNEKVVRLQWLNISRYHYANATLVYDGHRVPLDRRRVMDSEKLASFKQAGQWIAAETQPLRAKMLGIPPEEISFTVEKTVRNAANAATQCIHVTFAPTQPAGSASTQLSVAQISKQIDDQLLDGEWKLCYLGNTKSLLDRFLRTGHLDTTGGPVASALAAAGLVLKKARVLSWEIPLNDGSVEDALLQRYHAI